MKINTKKVEGRTIFEILDGRIDASTALEFKSHICDTIDCGPSEVVVLDLSRVNFIDSSGIGAVVGVFKHIGQRGSFAVAGLTRSVERVFQLTRMNKVFSIYATLEDALANY